MKIFKNIFFDLDGTITDSAIGIVNSIQYALKKYGIDAKNEELYKFIGPPLRESFAKYFGFSSSQAEEAVAFYREYFSEIGIYENELYPGIYELLETLKLDDRNLFLATSKPINYAERIIKHFKIDSFFLDIAGSNMDGTNSLKADLIGGIIKKFAIKDLSQSVMIGDRAYDVEGARVNKIYSIAVLYGYGEREEIEMSKPDYIASSIEELGFILLK